MAASIDSLASAFAGLASKEDSGSVSRTYYGTVNADGSVTIDGAETSTPAAATVSASEGDRVQVTIRNHTATITGNVTSPTITSAAAADAISEAVSSITVDTDAITAQVTEAIGDEYVSTTLVRQDGEGVEVARLIDGGYTSSKTLIDDTGLHVQTANDDGEFEESSSFESDLVELGKQDSSATVAMCKNHGVIKQIDDALCFLVNLDDSAAVSPQIILSGFTYDDSNADEDITGSTLATDAFFGYNFADRSIDALANRADLWVSGTEGPGVELMLGDDAGDYSACFQGTYDSDNDGVQVKYTGFDDEYSIWVGVAANGYSRGIYDITEGRYLLAAGQTGSTYIQAADGLYLRTSQGNKQVRYIDCGSVSVSGGSGSVTSASVTFNVTFDSTPSVMATAITTVPGTVAEVAVSGKSATGCTIYVMRSTSTSTTVQWQAAGYIS